MPARFPRFRHLAALTLAFAIAATAGCRRGSPATRLRVCGQAIADHTQPEDATFGVAEAALRQIVAGALAKAQTIELAPGHGHGASDASHCYRLRIDVRLQGSQVEGRAMVRALVAAALTTPGLAPIEAQIATEKTWQLSEQPDRGAVATTHMRRSLADTVRILDLAARLRVGPASALLAALSDPDADVRAQAARFAAERRLPAAVPGLLKLLDDPEERVRDGSLGALVAIGDPVAVGAITRRVRFDDLDGMRKTLDAIAAFPGEEAVSYLELVASGHHNLEIREMAAAALERRKRRQERESAGQR